MLMCAGFSQNLVRRVLLQWLVGEPVYALPGLEGVCREDGVG
jgi:hypothetical protein